MKLECHSHRDVPFGLSIETLDNDRRCYTARLGAARGYGPCTFTATAQKTQVLARMRQHIDSLVDAGLTHPHEDTACQLSNTLKRIMSRGLPAPPATSSATWKKAPTTWA